MTLSRRQLLAAAPAAFPLTSNLLPHRRGQGQGQGQGAPARPAATPKTRFAANIEMWWGNLPLLDRIRKAHELGFPAIEFWPWRGKDLAAIAALTKELGMAVAQFTAWGFSPGLNQQQNHARFVAEIEASCAAAKQLDCKLMTVVGGNDVKGMTQAAMHEQIIAGLALAAPIAERENVMLILEPMNVRVDHKGHCLYGSEAAVRICRAVASPMVKINWDLYHCHISEGDLCGHLHDGFDQLGYVQVADHPGRTEPGTGEIHYPRVLRELHALGYRGFVGVECNPSQPEAEAAKGLWFADQW
ncbi:MAG: TIM barrel protein [Planctomycetes bacterium]|nr:TIM barrel protein [Planctomycetota bacterium]